MSGNEVFSGPLRQKNSSFSGNFRPLSTVEIPDAADELPKWSVN
jgi:hypothetical protein